MARRGKRGESIADHDHQSSPAGSGNAQLLAASLIECAPEIGSQQILHPIPRLTRNDRRIAKSGFTHLPRYCFRVECRVYRIPSPSMSQIEVEKRTGGQAAARAPEPDPRRSELPQPSPYIALGIHPADRRDLVCIAYFSHSLAPSSSLRSPPAPNRSPRSLQMPIRSSHASNSGARRSPSTLRAYNASWNDVLW